METNGVMDAAIRDLQALFNMGVTGTLSDAQLLDRLVERQEEAVFEEIIRRHGPMVWGVCRRILRDSHDAEDAFQVTFLVLARKSASIRPREKLGNWLYGVAYQTAMKARAQRTKRQSREAHVLDMPEPMAAPDDPRDELAESLDRELSRLPEKYRIPIVLCDLEGWDHREAANQLGWPVGTVSSRLSRARVMLASRLSRRGLSLSAGSLALLLAQESASAGMPTRLIGHTAQAARLFAMGGMATAGVVPAKVAVLTAEVMKIMLLSKIKMVAVMVLAASALAIGGTSLAYRAQGSESASQEEAPGVKSREPSQGQEPPRGREPFQDQDPGNDDPGAKNSEERKRKVQEFVRPARTDKLPAVPEAAIPQPRGDTPFETPKFPLPTDPQHTMPAPVRAPSSEEDPLTELIVAGSHSPEQLERAKAVIESMITLEKEARGKSPKEIDKMIETRVRALEIARWEIRVMDAQLRRLKVIKQTRPGTASEPLQPDTDSNIAPP